MTSLFVPKLQGDYMSSTNNRLNTALLFLLILLLGFAIAKKTRQRHINKMPERDIKKYLLTN